MLGVKEALFPQWLLALLSLCLLASCQREGTKQPASLKKTSPPALQTDKDAPPGDKTASDFAREWAEIAVLRDKALQRQRALELKERWEGKRYRWTGYLMAGLCQEKKRTCNAQVFEHHQTPSLDLLGGFLPTLLLTEEGYASLREGCRGKLSCVISFNGLLKEARTEPEMPLGLTFADVSVQEARAPKAEEKWWKDKPSFPLPPDYQPRTLRLHPEEPPVGVDLSRLTRRTF